MPASRATPALLAAFALAFAGGCGDDDGGDGGIATQVPPATTTAESPREESVPGGTDEVDAAQTFATTCGGCHTLQAAGSGGSVGPNLDELQPDEERVRTAIEEGPGTMPENLLEGPEAEAVAAYVAENAGG